jgi:hypothetical protein
MKINYSFFQLHFDFLTFFKILFRYPLSYVPYMENLLPTLSKFPGVVDPDLVGSASFRRIQNTEFFYSVHDFDRMKSSSLLNLSIYSIFDMLILKRSIFIRKNNLRYHLVLRIRDMMVRIRIRGSVPQTNGFGSDSGSSSGSCCFCQNRQTFKMAIKNIFFPPSFFYYYFLKIYLHHFSKIKSHEEVTKQSQGFFTIFV